MATIFSVNFAMAAFYMNRPISNCSVRGVRVYTCKENFLWILTLKGSLSVLKLMPGTYFSQTGNPLFYKDKMNNRTASSDCMIRLLIPHRRIN